MRVQTEEWQRFIPGVRMYQGKMTLFYNGEKLWEGMGWSRPLIYDTRERRSWEVIIVLPGVEVVPEDAFVYCKNVKIVLMADTVRRIEFRAFAYCRSLEFVKLSRNLEFIGVAAFSNCDSLTSIFIPPLCSEIGNEAFRTCFKLIIFHVPQHTQLGNNVIARTALMEASPFNTGTNGQYEENNEEVNEWMKNRLADNQFSLHRACADFNPAEEVILDIIKRQGIGAFKKADSVGVTASQYLLQNPFTTTKEEMIMKHFILDMMGELV
ncbi:hypothetical protein CTEN210_18366 [Chaetoceros tenuissimus]|uniref:Leucine-rich repeat domain-containing protein n=1 Tax=Chaetoceros tenuissimus TaxID=426638 RepID=A0AAD3DEG4_9STRA|nr:hypothetical protein CTEN210_18366 [Chaetoceros tenuissimus]